MKNFITFASLLNKHICFLCMKAYPFPHSNHYYLVCDWSECLPSLQCSNTRAYLGTTTDDIDIAYRIVADHVRMASVCIADGLLPGSKSQGLVCFNWEQTWSGSQGLVCFNWGQTRSIIQGLVWFNWEQTGSKNQE